MSETTTDEMYDSYRRGQVWAIGTGDTAREKFDAWLAEVERAAAEKALTEAAAERERLYGVPNAPAKWLRNRAAALGLTAGQEEVN